MAVLGIEMLGRCSFFVPFGEHYCESGLEGKKCLSPLGYWEYDNERLTLPPFRFVLGAVSPAIVVLSMLLLQEKGYGVDKGIPTLLIAASSCDDIVAITGFNTFLGMAFSSGTVTVP